MSIDLSNMELCDHGRPRVVCGECFWNSRPVKVERAAGNLIGLNGYAHVGKDTVANALVATGQWERVALADPVRGAALAIDPLIRTPNYGGPAYRRLSEIVAEVGWDEAKKIEDVRVLLQRVGTEMGRDYLGPLIGVDDRLWVTIAERKMTEVWERGKGVVVTDVRFANEADWIHSWSRDAQVWRIVRPGYGPVNSHVSDALAGIDPDEILVNDSTVEELEDTAVRLAEARFLQQK